MITKIVSGGQTGADRAGLDVALELGIPIGGWLPKGRTTEDGVLPVHYRGLRETEEEDPSARTRLNVRDSDATVVLSHGAVTGGTRLAVEEARAMGRPLLHLDLRSVDPEVARHRLVEWLEQVRPRVLNVAGPRAGEDPEIYTAATAVLRGGIGRARTDRPEEPSQGRSRRAERIGPEVLLVLPVGFSLLLLAAHFARHDLTEGIVIVAILIGLLFVRRPWAGRTVQVALVLGSLEWARTGTVLTLLRVRLGEPAFRLAIILGGVAVFTAASALVFRSRPARSWFRLGRHSAPEERA